MGYDIIGDIHGHAGVLKELLRKLGYREQAGAWRQPGRQVIFVGDFIDRGPEQLETLGIVRRMVDAGAALAVMGNHEFNAISWNTRDPGAPGAYLRTHTPGHQRQHQAFLDATAGRPGELKSVLDWFWTLPLWLELPGLRVVHACWHDPYMAYLAPRLRPGHVLSRDVLVAGNHRGSPDHRAVEAVLKGPEVALPEGLKVRMGDEMRGEARTRWWDAAAATMRQAAIVAPGDRAAVPELPVPVEARPGYRGARPVFIGHYWMDGQPALLGPRVACVDYSAGRGRPLVAYRWEGERDLDAAHFIRSAAGLQDRPMESVAARATALAGAADFDIGK